LFLTLLEQNLARFTFVIKSATSDAWRACSNRPLTPSVSVVLIGPVIKAITSFPLVKTSDVTEEELYQFLKHFHLLNYDLAKEKGIVPSFQLPIRAARANFCAAV
jgi:hypothetical protein